MKQPKHSHFCEGMPKCCEVFHEYDMATCPHGWFLVIHPPDRKWGRGAVYGFITECPFCETTLMQEGVNND